MKNKKEESGGAKVNMILEGLLESPELSLPDGYTLKWFEKGDGLHWVKIHEQAENYLNVDYNKYLDQFGKHPTLLPKRICFILNPHGVYIATSSAWHNLNYHDQEFGRVHWVAVVPDEQGKGFGKVLLRATLNRLLVLGHSKAYLTTSTNRIAALHLYLNLDFVPDIQNLSDLAVWVAVAEKIKNLKLIKCIELAKARLGLS